MPIIYLKHPIHGLKVAISDMEAAHDETHGWSRYTLDTLFPQEPPAPEPAPAAMPAAATANALDGRRRRRSSPPQEVPPDGNSSRSD